MRTIADILNAYAYDPYEPDERIREDSETAYEREQLYGEQRYEDSPVIKW